MLPELESIARELDQNLRDINEFVSALGGDELERAPGGGHYSARQTLAHLAGADRGMTALMKQMVAGANPRLKPGYNNDYFNARQQEKRAGMNVDELRAELDAAHRDLNDFIGTLRVEDLDKRGEHPRIGDSSVLQVMNMLRQHEQEHLEELRELLDNPGMRQQ